MRKFMTKTLWYDFDNNRVNEEILDFQDFSKIMKLEVTNDAQILCYERVCGNEMREEVNQ